MPETADTSEPGVITPAEPAPEQAQTPEEPGVITPDEPAAPSDQEDYGWLDFTDQAEGLDEMVGAFNGVGEDDGIDWLVDDGIHDWLADDPAPQFNSQQEFDDYVGEQVGEVVQSYAYNQEMNARRDQLSGLEQKYPDIHDYVDRIRPDLEARAQQYGIDPQFLATDPALVEAVYKGLKADEEASPPEDPAEAFANRFSEMAAAPDTKDAFSE